MTVVCLAADGVVPQPWRNGGGQTRELLAWPSAQDWVLRVSRADITQDGPFSAFAGVRRWFAVLQGAGVRLHFPDGTRTLALGDAPLHFDGALAPGCDLVQGATQDLNLMLRAGEGGMWAVHDAEPWQPSFTMRGLYTAVAGTWRSGTQAHRAVAAHTLLWDSAADRSAWTFQPDASSTPGPAFWLAFTPAP